MHLKKLQFWHGKGEEIYKGYTINIAAFTKAQAISLLKEIYEEKNLIYERTFKMKYSPSWVEELKYIIPGYPCIWITKERKHPVKILELSTHNVEPIEPDFYQK